MLNNEFLVADFAIKVFILKMNVLLTTTRHRSTRFFASSLPTFLCLNNGIAVTARASEMKSEMMSLR